MKTIVITGTSRGIGFATATLFLKQGWQVIGTSTHAENLLDHKQFKHYPLNLSDSKQITSFVHHLPKFDVLINNAAVLLEPWDDDQININTLRETFNTNVFGTVELTEKCIPKLNNNGQVVNISSGWGTFSGNDSAYQPHYKMSKACLNMYTLLLTEKLSHLTISAFDPGWVKTDMGTTNAPKQPEKTAEEIYQLIMNTQKETGLFWKEDQIRDW